jgi:hypothetical protein
MTTEVTTNSVFFVPPTGLGGVTSLLTSNIIQINAHDFPKLLILTVPQWQSWHIFLVRGKVAIFCNSTLNIYARTRS